MKTIQVILLLLCSTLFAEKIDKNELHELSSKLENLQEEVARAKTVVQGKIYEKFIPDVEVFSTMLELTISSELGIEKKHKNLFLSLAEEGLQRAKELQSGKSPWVTKKGLVIRGYRSKLDDTCQPFVIITPEDFPNVENKRPLYINFPHAGKREPMSFMSFARKGGKTFAGENDFHLEIYARGYTTGKFAGETAVFEEIENALKEYPIDRKKLLIHGFSNGGSATWHFAAHFPHLWNAASPGAGYPDSESYMGVPNWDEQPSWYETMLFKLNSATDVVSNLNMLPVYSYVGEYGAHRFAHDHVIREAAKEGVFIKRILGPKTGHKYEPKAKEFVRVWLEEKSGQQKSVPENIHYSTFSLRYNKCHWLEIDLLIEHWQESSVNIKKISNGTLQIDTANIEQFSLNLNEVFNQGKKVKLIINGFPIDLDNTEKVSLRRKIEVIKKGRKIEIWHLAEPVTKLAKVHGLTGPIDDYLYDRFINVLPTYKGVNQPVDNWVKNELDFAKGMWHLRFNGKALEQADKSIAPSVIESSHLVLWGTPQTNKFLSEVLGKLPIEWNEKELIVNGKKYDSRFHVPVMIYPNPLNPEKYIVLNSGFTCRAKGGTSANFTAKLPDWAVIDVREEATEKYPGKVVDAGFFNENWEFNKGDK